MKNGTATGRYREIHGKLYVKEGGKEKICKV
jgi:hypothetical protein